MSDQNIMAALQMHLREFAAAKGLRVAHEGVGFTPVADETYLADFLLPAATDNPSLGRSHRRFVGVFQVDVRSAGKDPVALRRLTNELAEHFPRGLGVTSGGQVTLVIRDPAIGPVLPDAARMKRSVSVRYQSDVIRS